MAIHCRSCHQGIGNGACQHGADGLRRPAWQLSKCRAGCRDLAATRGEVHAEHHAGLVLGDGKANESPRPLHVLGDDAANAASREPGEHGGKVSPIVCFKGVQWRGGAAERSLQCGDLRGRLGKVRVCYP